MTRTIWVGVGMVAAAVAMSGCNPARIGERRNEKPYVAAARLDCPDTQGELRRQSTAPDGLSCRYAGDAGETVDLRLVSLQGRTAASALQGIEQELRAAIPAAAAADRAAANADADEADADARQGDRVAVSATDRDGRDEAHIDLPGFHVNTNGDKAEVNLPGLHINADGDKADVQVNRPGGRLASIHASDGGAEVRTGDVGPKNVDASYILASDAAGPDGARSGGYVARGPIGGPLVVAVETRRSRHDESDGDHDSLHDARRLVKLNVTRAR